jgi:hypothetical protein
MSRLYNSQYLVLPSWIVDALLPSEGYLRYKTYVYTSKSCYYYGIKIVD